jgi:hypothetical protein
MAAKLTKIDVRYTGIKLHYDIFSMSPIIRITEADQLAHLSSIDIWVSDGVAWNVAPEYSALVERACKAFNEIMAEHITPVSPAEQLPQFVDVDDIVF